MPKATIEDVVNIAVGAGVCANTPAARERYKDIVRQQSRIAASGSTAPLPKRKPAASAPAQQPTEYPSAWKQARRVAAGIRVGRKADTR
jgi:hypothetical protein